MTREEAQRQREEELAGQAHGKDCFIIPQANLDRFLPDGVTVSLNDERERWENLEGCGYWWEVCGGGGIWL